MCKPAAAVGTVRPVCQSLVPIQPGLWRELAVALASGLGKYRRRTGASKLPRYEENKGPFLVYVAQIEVGDALISFEP